ncbi:hypothetical protein BJ322DRAFT_401594 [Thelephora terrestris]|uniref:Uncharacterized protein n=1 Tax=Thelephora terrestris TaxID=56493 RepID=A0A9P6HMP8_9AGAM|nr:hypothetical protein BJ322DRAFT_401594 [Thelephora terrestris]
MPPKNPRNGTSETSDSAISRSSSVTVVSPAARDTVGDIVTHLQEINDLIDGLGADPGDVPDKKILLQELSKLNQDVNKIKLDQDTQVKAIKDDIQKKTKNEILESVGDKIQASVVEAVAAETKRKMQIWGEKPHAGELTQALQGTSDENDVLLGKAKITLENSLSRHANSTLDIEYDRNTNLKTIKRKDGRVSELFPLNLGEFFSQYDAERLVHLFKEYDLRPLEKYEENLTRFLMFIGMLPTSARRNHSSDDM